MKCEKLQVFLQFSLAAAFRKTCLKTSQHASQFFRNAAAKSGILGQNNPKKMQMRNPRGTD